MFLISKKIVLFILVAQLFSQAKCHLSAKQSTIQSSIAFSNGKVAGDEIDASLYSRQLFVYGKSAQQKLQEAKILVVGNGTLANEVVKNLALAGVGSMHCFPTTSKENISLISSDGSLCAYARSINPNILVKEIKQDLRSFIHGNQFFKYNFTSVIVCGEDFEILKKLDSLCRKSSTKLIACDVSGVCGFVFNDFGPNFKVVDKDGETYKEIPLSDLIDTDQDKNLIKINSIPEESLGLGIGDLVQIQTIDVTATVENVIDSQSCIISLQNHEDMNSLLDFIKSGKATIKKLKQSATIHHKPLLSQLLKPTFNPANECLNLKKDKARSLTLLSCFKAYRRIHSYEEKNLGSRDTSSPVGFRTTVEQELKMCGVDDLSLHWKKGGQVGVDMLDDIVERFRKSVFPCGKKMRKKVLQECSLRCPATCSVVGAIASQETIKSVTGLHMPLSQWVIFDSLDSLPQNTDPVTSTPKEPSQEPSLSGLELLYGPEVVNEFRKMRIFIVGAGAIGCELLKNFALMGVSQGLNEEKEGEIESEGENGFNEMLWRESGLMDGGILVTDMDTIERSNLNRQLLFRERHIGMSKSEVAAKQVREINPFLRIKGATQKLSEEESGSPFSEDFWENTDVVITALDNVAARLLVDAKCVQHGRWLLDSGTLGTKGNTQVIVPHLTESYADSADPPEQAIPLCTLKSFPYQSDHCVAWAKNMFEELFFRDIGLLKNLLSLIETSSKPSKLSDKDIKKIKNWIEDNLSVDDCLRLKRVLNFLPIDSKNAIKWSIDLFNHLFVESVQTLLSQHPTDETDEEGVPFWSGSRRIPEIISFENTKNDSEERRFFLFGAQLYSRILFQKTIPTADLDEIFEKMDIDNNREKRQTYKEPDFNNEITNLIRIIKDKDMSKNLDYLISKLDKIQPESFEKDDESLGHVAFITAASNLRCRAYGLKELDKLEVQKVAGNIVPALATTTAFVSGLVSLELLKIASERVRFRQKVLEKLRIEEENTKSQSFTSRFFGKKTQKSSKSESNPSTSPILESKILRDCSKEYLNAEKDRILERFRNGFVNLARPMLAFAQPVEVEKNKIGDIFFSPWDFIEAPGDSNDLTIEGLKTFLEDKFNVQLQSVSWKDNLLYADFLQSEEDQNSGFSENKTIQELVEEALSEEESSLDSRDSDSNQLDQDDDKEEEIKVEKEGKQKNKGKQSKAVEVGKEVDNEVEEVEEVVQNEVEEVEGMVQNEVEEAAEVVQNEEEEVVMDEDESEEEEVEVVEVEEVELRMRKDQDLDERDNDDDDAVQAMNEASEIDDETYDDDDEKVDSNDDDYEEKSIDDDDDDDDDEPLNEKEEQEDEPETVKEETVDQEEDDYEDDDDDYEDEETEEEEETVTFTEQDDDDDDDEIDIDEVDDYRGGATEEEPEDSLDPSLFHGQKYLYLEVVCEEQKDPEQDPVEVQMPLIRVRIGSKLKRKRGGDSSSSSWMTRIFGKK